MLKPHITYVFLIQCRIFLWTLKQEFPVYVKGALYSFSETPFDLSFFHMSIVSFGQIWQNFTSQLKKALPLLNVHCAVQCIAVYKLVYISLFHPRDVQCHGRSRVTSFLVEVLTGSLVYCTLKTLHKDEAGIVTNVHIKFWLADHKNSIPTFLQYFFSEPPKFRK